MADHLSRLDQKGLKKQDDSVPINDIFPGEQLLQIAKKKLPWYVDIANYLVSGVSPYGVDFR